MPLKFPPRTAPPGAGAPAERPPGRLRRRAAVALGLTLAGLVAAPGFADAAVRHVSTTGANSGNCLSSACLTIAYAVGQSGAGDTVKIAAGDYVESQIAITKPVTLQGAGSDETTVLQNPANPGSTAPGLINVSSPATGNITIDDLKLAGANRSNSIDQPFLIFVSSMPAGGTLTVSDSELYADTTLDPDLGEDYSNGLYAVNSGADVRVVDSRFEGMFQALFLENVTGAADISGNTFEGLLASNCGDASCGGLRMPNGVFLLGYSGSKVIEPQVIADNDFRNFAGMGVVVNATTSGSGYGDLDVRGNRMRVDGANDITNRPANLVHLVAFNGAEITSPEITGNDLEMPSGPGRGGIFVAETSSSSPTPGIVSGVTASFNRIVGSFDNAITNHAAAGIDADNNWWGCNTGPHTDGCATTGGPGGHIDVLPYLKLRTSVSPETVYVDQPATVTASLGRNSAGKKVEGALPSGLPIRFTTGIGDVSDSKATTSGWEATTTFSSATAGVGQIGATLDKGTASAAVTVKSPPETLVLPPADPAKPTVSLAALKGSTMVAGRSQAVTVHVGAPAGLAFGEVTYGGRRVCVLPAGSGSCEFTPRRRDAGRRVALGATVTDRLGRSDSATRIVRVAGAVRRGAPVARVRGGTAAVRLRCPKYGDCAGRVELRRLVDGRPVAIGSASFGLDEPRGVVDVALSDGALAALDAAVALNARLHITSNGVTRSQLVSLR